MYTSWTVSPRGRIIVGLASLTTVSTILYVAGAIANHSLAFKYMPWNLFLAWLPLIFSVALIRVLRTHRWTSTLPLVLTLLWLILLPNSFYMISDFVHIQDIQRHNLLYDIVMFTSFIFTAVLLGFSSLRMVHGELHKRIKTRNAHVLIGVILLLCSFGVYLGRDLRWNSWDVLINPAGILFDVSDHLIHPLQYGAMFTTTLSFFLLLGTLYAVGWQLEAAVKADHS